MLQSSAHFLAGHFLAMLMLSVGLRTESAIVRDISRHSKVLLRTLLIVWVGVPLYTLAVIYIDRPVMFDAAALMVMAICPGVPLVLGKTKRTHGHYRISLLILLTTALTALVMVPLWAAFLRRFTPFPISFSLGDAAKVLLPTVIVPYTLGRVVQELWPRIAKPLATIAQALFVLGLGLLIAFVLIRRIPDLGHLGVREVIAAVLIPFGAAALGYLATHGEQQAARVSVTYASALGNPALALAVMAHSYSVKAVPVVLAFILIRAIALLPFNALFKRRRHHEEARAQRPGPLLPAHGT